MHFDREVPRTGQGDTKEFDYGIDIVPQKEANCEGEDSQTNRQCSLQSMS